MSICDWLRVCWTEKMNLNMDLRYRSVVMGIAIVWVYLSHLPVYYGYLFPITTRGHIGVDLFVFLSGVGCYYSLTSNPDGFEFMKRRVLRLVPTYWTFVILFYFPFIHPRLYFPQDYVGILSFVPLRCDDECRLNGAPSYKRVNWYVGGMWVFYGILPEMVPFVQRHITSFPRLVYGMAVLIMASVPIGEDLLSTLTSLRIPSLLAGVYFGKCSKESPIIKPSRWIPLVLLIFISLWHLCSKEGNAKHHINLISTLPAGAFLLISCAAKHLHKWTVGRFILLIFSTIGGYTFEILIWHVSIIHYFEVIYPPRRISYKKCRIVTLVATIVGTIVLRKISSWVEPIFLKLITWFENWFTATETNNEESVV